MITVSFLSRFDEAAKLCEIGHAGGGLGVWFYGSERQDQETRESCTANISDEEYVKT